MTSAEFPPAPLTVPSPILPNLEYTLYQPEQLKSRIPALMIHGFATRGEQLYGGTGWIRQYLRAGRPVLLVDLPYHTDAYLKDPEFSVDCKLPDSTRVHSGEASLDAKEAAAVSAGQLTPLHSLIGTLTGLLRDLADEYGLESRAHVIGFSFGASLGWELALTHPEAVVSLTLGGLPLHDHLITLRAMLEARENTSPSASAETPAADSTTEAIASFEAIIDGSPIRTEALLKFVSIPFGPFFDGAALRTGSPELPAGAPGAHPRMPVMVVLGGVDTIAADGAELYEMVRADHPLNRFLSLPGRDHVNALTAGLFRRGALSFASEVEAADTSVATS